MVSLLYQWQPLTGTLDRDQRKDQLQRQRRMIEDRRFVGNIHETKMRELKQERKQMIDPVTLFTV